MANTKNQRQKFSGAYRFFSAIICETLMMGVDFGLFLEGGRGPLRGTMTTSEAGLPVE